MYSYGTSVLFVCRLCKDSFQIVDDFIEHKKEKHSVEFRTSNCIVFEDILILNTNNDEEKNCGRLSTVNKNADPAPSFGVPLVRTENNFTDVDLSHIQQHIPHDPAGAFDPFPISTCDNLNNDSHENFSYQDDNKTSDNSLQPGYDDYHEAVDMPQAPADVSFKFIEPKMELTEFEEDREINWTASGAFDQGPPNPYVLLKKISSKEFQNYSRLENQQDTVQSFADAEVTSESRCKLCLKKFNSEAELEMHCKVCLVDNNKLDRYCFPCKKRFSSKWFRNEHKIRVHGTEEEKRKLFKFKCDVCPKQYWRKDLFLRHVESHKETNSQTRAFNFNQFQCTEPGCEKAFKREDYLRKHLKYLHSNILELFKCPEPNCTSEFSRKESLGRHLRTCMTKRIT